MTTALFRHEAIEAQQTKIWGEITFSLPSRMTVTTCFLVACVAAIGTFLATGTYARRDHVPGFLAARLGVANIVAQRPGTIEAVYVKEGQFVEKGTPLLSVNVEQLRQTGGGIDSEILASLRQQGARLDEQIGLERRRSEMDTKRLTTEIEELAREIDTVEQQRKLQATRTQMAREQAAAMDFLAKRGTGTQNDLKTRQDNLLAAQQAELNFAAALAAKQKELRALRSELAQLPVGTDQRIAQLRASISEIETRIQQTDGERAYLTTAPKSGYVSVLQAWVGKSAEPNIPLMSIVPEGDTLTAELFVPMRAIGFIEPGQTVHLQYASFPYQQFGFAEGTVDTVSRTLIKPDQAVGPLSFGAPAYRVSVSLKRQSIQAYGKEVPLKADMQLEADIIFNRRSLIAWLFEPLLASWQRRA